ncbi:MAG: ABC transporter substrate-binding protein [Chloroflexota bacterium]
MLQKLSVSLLLIAVWLLAACSGQPAATPPPAAPAEAEQAQPAAEEAQPPAEEAASTAAGNDLEVFSYWTSGGEAAALDALFSTYKAEYPETNIINAVIAGGAGSNAFAVLQTRLAGGDPPDVWQTHPGAELFGRYVDPDYAAPVTDLYQQEGWLEKMPEQLVESMTAEDGQIYAVMVGIHRGNDLWYNKKLLAEHDLEIGDSLSFDEFFQIADTLKEAKVPALCVGDSGIWASAIILENSLISALGERYNGLWDGSVSFEDPAVKQAIQQYGRMLEYQNDDHAALSWDQAAKKLIEGGCAFTVMGDWAYGEFVNAKLKDNEDFGWVDFPGTQDYFDLVADGFVLAKDAPNPEAAKAWMKSVSSLPAQEAFNPLKGSICARTDCDRQKFGGYHNWSMDSFASDAVVPSIIGGAAAPADWQQAYFDGVTKYVVDKNVDALAQALAQAAQEAGIDD